MTRIFGTVNTSLPERVPGEKVSDYILIETIDDLRLPVGSVLATKGKGKTYYRDIDARHIFSPNKNYKALAIDDRVVRHLDLNDNVNLATFYRKDTGELLTTKFANFVNAPVRVMRGRPQRFCNFLSFEKKAGKPFPRPEKKVFI